MNDRGIRRWVLLGALVSAALLTPACERDLPREGTDHEGLVNEAQDNEKLPEPQQPGTGGSGVQQQQADDSNIGAPGYSAPNEPPRTDQGPEVPPPDQSEAPSTVFRAGEEGRESPPSK